MHVHDWMLNEIHASLFYSILYNTNKRINIIIADRSKIGVKLSYFINNG